MLGAAIAPRRMLAATRSLVGVAQRITCPIFIMNGRPDRIVPCDSARSRVRSICDHQGRQPRGTTAPCSAPTDDGAAVVFYILLLHWLVALDVTDVARCVGLRQSKHASW
jgi:hypothetical protein